MFQLSLFAWISAIVIATSAPLSLIICSLLAACLVLLYSARRKVNHFRLVWRCKINMLRGFALSLFRRKVGVAMKRTLTIVAAFLLTVLHTPVCAQTKRIAAGYSAISATQTGFYIAKDAKIFEKHGLYVDPVYVAGGSRMAQAIIAGEFALALAGGNIVNVNLAGGD